MNGFPWLTIAGAVPLLGAIVIMLVPGLPADSAEADVRARQGLAKYLALAFSLITLVVVIIIAVKFQVGGPNYQFTETYSWIPAFGVHYALGVDGIALVLIAMSAVLMPVVILASWNDADPVPRRDDDLLRRRALAKPRHSVKTYFALMMVLETMMIGVFAATDVFLFYVFFEAMLVPMYFMIGSYGVGKRQYAAVKFLLYSLLGGLLMLVAVIALYVYSVSAAAHRAPRLVPVQRAGQRVAEPDRAEVAVPRVLHRVRDQGAAVAVPHLAARRRRLGAARRGGAAGRRAGQGGHVRHAAVLLRAVPGRREVLHPAGHHAGGDRGSCTGPSWPSASRT